MSNITDSKNWWVKITGVTSPDTTPSIVSGQVPVLDFGLNLSAVPTGLGKSIGKVAFSECNLQLQGDAAGGLLFDSMIKQQSLGSIVVTGLKTVGSAVSIFVVYTFTNCYTTNLGFQQASDGGLSIGSFSFAYTQVQMKAFSESKGVITPSGVYTYDLEAQVAS
jgi:type VI protein secretion system component Hcp